MIIFEENKYDKYAFSASDLKNDDDKKEFNEMIKIYSKDIKDGKNVKDPNFFVRMIKKFRSIYEKFLSKYNLINKNDYKKKSIFKRLLYRIVKFIDKLAFKLQSLLDRRSNDQKSKDELIDDIYDKSMHKNNYKHRLDSDMKKAIYNAKSRISMKRNQDDFNKTKSYIDKSNEIIDSIKKDVNNKNSNNNILNQANNLLKLNGKTPQFNNMEEFDKIMMDKNTKITL